MESHGNVLASAKDISIGDLRISVPGRELLSCDKLAFPYGSKSAILGRNGAGKSCLCKAIQALLPTDVHTLDQFSGDVSSEDTVLDAVLASDTLGAQLRTRLGELERAADDESVDYTEEMCDELDKITTALKARSAPHQAHKILHGLGFDNITVACKTLSGGWLQRLALAKALYAQPRVLVLDEPTNHLDMDGIMWLSHFLKGYKQTCIVVSHDVGFVEEFATRYIVVAGGTVQILKTLEHAFEKMGLGNIAVMEFEESSYELRPDASIQLRSVSYAYPLDPQRVVIQNMDICINASSRVAIIGPNGSGKTTLLKIMCGALEPTEGEVVRHRKLRHVYIDQHDVSQFETDCTPLEVIMQKYPNLTLTDAHKVLSKFNVSSQLRRKQMSGLSGGERARVLLSMISLADAHVLFLDEPTNHLDLETTIAVATALKSFKGGCVLVTHNKTLLDCLGDAQLIHCTTKAHSKTR